MTTMPKLRFCVLGDTHYCTMSQRQVTRTSGIAPDAPRYAGFTQDVLPRLAALVSQQQPDILFSTGDLIEGMRAADPQGQAANLADEQAAQALFRAAAPQFVCARGTHDRLHDYQEYASFTLRDCVFIVLDYTHWDETQKTWLKQELERTDDARRRFVLAHPPLYLFGRHFFDSQPFCQDVAALLKTHPVDAYFGGHTHNQTVGFLDGALHVTGSSLGYPVACPPALEEWHALPEKLKAHYLWGIPEDFDPAFWTIDIEDETLTMTRHTLHGEAGKICQQRRFSLPETVLPPPLQRLTGPLAASDQLQIKSATLNLFGVVRGGSAGSALRLNGTHLGPLPPCVCYEARHFIQLPQEMLASIGSRNQLQVTFPSQGPFALGSLTLTLTFLDGRQLMSNVNPEKFVCGHSPDFTQALAEAQTVSPGEQRTVQLDFV